jgi:HEAT repeat protein
MRVRLLPFAWLLVGVGLAWLVGSLLGTPGRRSHEAARTTSALAEGHAEPARLRGRPTEDATPRPAPPGATALDEWLRRLDGPDRATRGDALTRIRTLGPKAAPAADRVLRVFLEGDGGLDLLASFALAAMGPEGLARVEDALTDPDPRIRAGAALTLEHVADLGPRMEDALRRDLTDSDARVRTAAIRAWSSRADAADAMTASLAERLNDSSGDVRRAAALALGRWHADPEVAVPALAGLLTRPGEAADTRLEAIWALARYGPTGAPAAEALADAGASAEPAVAREAFRALSLQGPAAAAAVPTLLRQSARPDEPLRSAALAALAGIAVGRPEAADRLTEAVVRGEPAAREVVGGLVRGGDTGVALLRHASADAAGRATLAGITIDIEDGARGDATRAALVGLVEDSDEGIARLALRSLAAGGGLSPSEVRSVAEAMRRAPAVRRAEFARVLGEVGTDSAVAAAALLDAARAGDAETRLAAVRGLGFIGVADDEIVGFLRGLANEPAAPLAPEARRALSRLRE